MELINRGSIVSCTTCFNQTIEGGVMAFDPTTKMLILKCAAASGQAKLNDVYVVNLELCSEVQIKEEVNTIPNAPPLLNIQRIATRKRNAVDEKRRLVLALTAGVTPEGQRLFMAISKTIGPQVTWQGSDICVFGDTFVTHPYRPENVRGSSDRRVIYVKKLVESQWKDVAPAAATPDAKTIGSTSNSTQPAAPTSNGAANVAASNNSSAVSSSSSSNASSTVTATSSNNNQSTSAASAN